MSRLAIAEIITSWFPGAGSSIEWVAMFGKTLTTRALLKCFGFPEEDIEFIAENMDTLVKIMRPPEAPEQLPMLNAIAGEVYRRTERYILYTGLADELLRTAGPEPKEELLSLCTSNLIGLFIQSYEAGRGLLSNTLLQCLEAYPAYREKIGTDFSASDLVMETLRFDSPIQHTRRYAGRDLEINGHAVRQGQGILVLLASANRDPARFTQPNLFDPTRSNKEDHLTYGVGRHRCPGKKFAMELTADVIGILFQRYGNITLLNRPVQYESLPNVRLPKEIWIGLS